MKHTRSISKWGMVAMTTCLSVFGLSSLAADAQPGAAVAGTWQPHKDSFDYYGITSLYTCSGLEEHTKQILLHFGARRDIHVNANGCARGDYSPSHYANVHVEFYTLAPAADATAAGTVNAQWTALEMRPRHPFFIGDGDCELIKGMQEFLARNFTLRDVEYSTGCVPHDITLNGFSVKAEALKAIPTPKVSALTH
jgi:hypothetical protein